MEEIGDKIDNFRKKGLYEKVSSKSIKILNKIILVSKTIKIYKKVLDQKQKYFLYEKYSYIVSNFTKSFRLPIPTHKRIFF